MLILARGGLWRRPEERGSLEAFGEALRLGFGVAADIRDQQGELVLADGPPGEAWRPRLSDLLALYEVMGAPVALALRVRASGLQGLVQSALADTPARGAFLHDMAVTDHLATLRAGLPTFTRQSEYEVEPVFYDLAKGVWLESFSRDWIDAAAIAGHLGADKAVVLASPELHGRDHRGSWEGWAHADHAQVMLCTDFPAEAQVFFNERPAA